MRRSRHRHSNGFLAALFGLALAIGCLCTPAVAQTNALWDFGIAAQRVEDLKRVSAYLTALAQEPLPRGVTAQERTDGFVLAQWLRNSSRKMHHLARGWGVLLSRVPKKNGSSNKALIERLQEMNRSFSVQYLELLAMTRQELSAFAWQSAILKERQQRAGYLLDTLQ